MGDNDAVRTGTPVRKKLRRSWVVTPPGFGGFLSGSFGAARMRLGAAFEREIEAGRGFLWLPVIFGIGILGYFALPREPLLVALVAAFAALTALAIRRRQHAPSLRLLLVLATIAAGFVAAKVRTDLAVAPVLPREMTAVATGWIAGAEESAAGGRRIRLRVAAIEGVAPADTPRLARITIRGKAAASLAVGDAIAVTASLSPPGGPVQPGGYDFAFVPFYERIGAVGFAFGAARPAGLGTAPLDVRLAVPLARLRDTIRVRIEEALPGDWGHIAAALVMGDQRGIAQKTQDDMRASGLGHILSISGLHLALVAGSVFWLIRALLALSPTLALTFPIKKWAAAGALAVATFYLGISGAEVATVRSYVMLGIMLGAILIDRRALTLRNVALAALVILIFSPESLLSISFQMSFAATVALIATYETMSARLDRSLVDRSDPTIFTRVRGEVATLFLTSLIAGLATAPFGAYYFQRVAPFTIVANMAAAPAVGFLVMPMALLAMIVMPFGVESVPLAVMKWGLQWIVAVAEKTAAWSAGLGGVAAPPASALLLMVAGFLWLALWRERWRWAGIVPILLAVPLAVLTPRPDILIDDTGSAVAVRAADGRLTIMGSSRFDVENWLRADADPRKADAADLSAGVLCDPLGCITGASGRGEIALVKRRDAFGEDCRTAKLVLSGLNAPPGCERSALVIDREALDRFGAHALYAGTDGYRIETAYPEVRRPFMPPVRQR